MLKSFGFTFGVLWCLIASYWFFGVLDRHERDAGAEAWKQAKAQPAVVAEPAPTVAPLPLAESKPVGPKVASWRHTLAGLTQEWEELEKSSKGLTRAAKQAANGDLLDQIKSRTYTGAARIKDVFDHGTIVLTSNLFVNEHNLNDKELISLRKGQFVNVKCRVKKYYVSSFWLKCDIEI